MNPSDPGPNKLDRRSFLMGSAAGLAGLTAATTTEVSLGAQTESVACDRLFLLESDKGTHDEAN